MRIYIYILYIYYIYIYIYILKEARVRKKEREREREREIWWEDCEWAMWNYFWMWFSSIYEFFEGDAVSHLIFPGLLDMIPPFLKLKMNKKLFNEKNIYKARFFKNLLDWFWVMCETSGEIRKRLSLIFPNSCLAPRNLHLAKFAYSISQHFIKSLFNFIFVPLISSSSSSVVVVVVEASVLVV